MFDTNVHINSTAAVFPTVCVFSVCVCVARRGCIYSVPNRILMLKLCSISKSRKKAHA